VGAALPVGLPLVHEALVGFVDQVRGCKRVAGRLTGEVAVRDISELVVHERQEPV
jgi:hypothetical protein